MRQRKPKPIRIHRPEWKLILNEFRLGPCDDWDLIAATGRSRTTVKRYIDEMLVKKLIRVHSYERTRAHPTPVYCIRTGYYKDAQFVKLTKYERFTRSRKGESLVTPSNARHNSKLKIEKEIRDGSTECSTQDKTQTGPATLVRAGAGAREGQGNAG